jgi:uncharacterized protein (DUF302 family)
MRRGWFFPLLASLLLLSGTVASAEGQGTLMARSQKSAEVVMEETQEALRQRGYAIAHIQKCDGGLAEFGYKSDFYQVIFFGKVDEVRALLQRVPQMAAYLPLKLVLFAERDDTVLAALDPLQLVADPDPQLADQLARWHNDLRDVLREVRNAP